MPVSKPVPVLGGASNEQKFPLTLSSPNCGKQLPDGVLLVGFGSIYLLQSGGLYIYICVYNLTRF